MQGAGESPTGRKTESVWLRERLYFLERVLVSKRPGDVREKVLQGRGVKQLGL